MKDIQNATDIKLMVDTFYTAIREDEVLGPIFNGVIQDKWDIHLDKMVRFWQTILLQEYTYKGSPFHPHRKLPIGSQQMRAAKMAEMFQYKLASNNI